MAKMKKLFAMFLTLCLIFSFSTTAFASSVDEREVPVASADFKRVCDQVFEGKGEVYNANGIDITNSFLTRYNAIYQSGNYDAILSGCFKEGISQLTGHKNIVPDVTTRTVLHPQYEESVVHLVKQNGFPYDGKSWYLVVTATGSYGYQDSTNEIIDFPSPTINVSFSDLGALFSGSLDSIRTTKPAINSNKTSASFTVTTTHTVSCPIPGVDYVTGTLGPFTNVSNFAIEV